MLFRRSACLICALVACLVLLAACSSSATPMPRATMAPSAAASLAASPMIAPAASASMAAVAGGAHQFMATLSVTGAVTKSAQFSEPLSVLPPCANMAQTGAGDSTWSMPVGNPDQTFTLNWNVSSYTGPGTYADPKTYQGSVEVDAGGAAFVPVAASVMSVTVNADGSGSANFANLQDQYTQKAISGSETWTCQ